MKIKRSAGRPFAQRNADTPHVFDPTYATAEISGLLGKYAQAEQFLSGVGLNPDTHPEKGYAPFTHPLIGALNSTNATVTNTTGAANATNDASGPRPIVQIPGTAQMALTDDVAGGMDILYYGNLEFGSHSPSQVLTVDIDTGSADLWVPVNCRSCAGDSFRAYESSSYHTLGQRFSVSYGAGKVSGSLAQDVVSVGPLSVAQQTFGAVKSETEDFYDAPSDGLLGLAFGSIAQSRQPTFFENLMTSKQVASGAFAVHLQRDQAAGGEVCFGCFDTTKAIGPITWSPVVSRTYWSLGLNKLAVNQWQGVPANLTAAIDTGTTLIYLPDDVTSQFYALIPGSKQALEYGAGFYTYPCDTPLAVTLTFGGRAYSVDPADFNLGRTSAASPDCVGGILALGQGFPDNLAIIGYSIYDYPGNRIGFALSVNNKDPP
ncbi:aspartic peptidase domain-containing protein [Fomitopsis serialis]|uniref:aspartic peptidase domain-containing protein n=1 Tax=Fomitopsis serialis TaxID=139415 RepID=UPI0020079F19|nr:aspartic peptidase domain-containing protein [Neoantrodia serialis]KAH9935665.1 aspartic peptidase domain-containing protein [Neoantrodia serialis]